MKMSRSNRRPCISAVMQASIQLYQELMFAPGPLRRDQREMIAVAVSRANGCVY